MEDFTATNLSKLSSTKMRMASDRASIEFCRNAIPRARSWYVALGCIVDKKALGSNDLDVIEHAASGAI